MLLLYIVITYNARLRMHAHQVHQFHMAHLVDCMKKMFCVIIHVCAYTHSLLLSHGPAHSCDRSYGLQKMVVIYTRADKSCQTVWTVLQRIILLHIN
jgi:hypothetical protein